jgi:tetratricopeptide (TPR) repeat protein
LDPKYANSYGVLASVYEKIGKNGQAIEYHKKVLQIDPEDEYSRYNLVLLYSKLGMKKEALEEYEILKRKNSIFAPELKSMLEREQ